MAASLSLAADPRSPAWIFPMSPKMYPSKRSNQSTQRLSLRLTKVARGAQVSAEAMSRFEPLMEKDPMFALMVSVIFSAGAKWADKHPVSEFGSVEAWKAAQRKKAADMLNEIPAAKRADAFIVMLHHAMFAEGAQWAVETPAPTL